MDFTVRLVGTDEEMEAVRAIRRKVFVEEQDVPMHIEQDEADQRAKHVIALYQGKPVGCARMNFERGAAVLGRLALLPEYRGKGLGRAIMQYMVDYCKQAKVEEIAFDAQYYLKDFYLRMGFLTRGEPFMKAGIKHIRMFMRG